VIFSKKVYFFAIFSIFSGSELEIEQSWNYGAVQNIFVL
jgi:hypothetical protein